MPLVQVYLFASLESTAVTQSSLPGQLFRASKLGRKDTISSLFLFIGKRQRTLAVNRGLKWASLFIYIPTFFH